MNNMQFPVKPFALIGSSGSSANYHQTFHLLATVKSPALLHFNILAPPLLVHFSYKFIPQQFREQQREVEVWIHLKRVFAASTLLSTPVCMHLYHLIQSLVSPMYVPIRSSLGLWLVLPKKGPRVADGIVKLPSCGLKLVFDKPCCHLKLWSEWSSCEWGGNWVKRHLPGSSSVPKSEVVVEAFITWFQVEIVSENPGYPSRAVGEKLADSFFQFSPATVSQALLSMSVEHIRQKNLHETVSG